eukprot:CAMPEP_0194545696 /NCGR_PEP_ID=MMETSP0253-20130528/89573_1 /TAXON_ID=2966 /ORGANISM="Noctiluca scintillans" /LENGTH=96 /DNA_ID=CAMNT_0039392717 /DNA_START=248 /DNA_END=538 /DNA_ORIENTATION=+
MTEHPVRRDVVHKLAVVDARDHRCMVVDGAHHPQHAVLEFGKAFALAKASATGGINRHRTYDDHVNFDFRVEFDGSPKLHDPSLSYRKRYLLRRDA